MQDPYLPNVMKIKKLIVSSEDRAGDIWGHLNDYDEGKENLLFSLRFF